MSHAVGGHKARPYDYVYVFLASRRRSMLSN